uniref:Tumor necrosis factor ligand superfamily member 10 n=1 Tax=Periophthalmus magnuspinnatus TaxID=409849 RepID=A0A3B4BA32_9GOBI
VTSFSSRFRFPVVLFLGLTCVSVCLCVFKFVCLCLFQMKETFARSSVSCLTLTGADLSSSDPCSQVTQQLHLLIEKSLSQRYQRQISSAVRDEVSRVLPSVVLEGHSSSRPKVAAHVTGSFVSKPSQDAGGDGRRVQGQKISWWEGQRGLAFLQDVQLQQGELVVSRGGLYYVYAQVYFRHHQGEPEESEEPEEPEEPGRRGGRGGGHCFSISYPVPILLMKTSRTSCWSRGSEFSLHSAHQGGLFPLATGDRLFVTVTNASAVDMDERSSFFGAFLIS